MPFAFSSVKYDAKKREQKSRETQLGEKLGPIFRYIEAPQLSIHKPREGTFNMEHKLFQLCLAYFSLMLE